MAHSPRNRKRCALLSLGPSHRHMLGESEVSEGQEYPSTAKVLGAPRAGRSFGSLRLVARGHGNYSGHRDWDVRQCAATTTPPPSKFAFTGCQLSIGNGAVAHLTGDVTAGEAAHPYWSTGAGNRSGAEVRGNPDVHRATTVTVTVVDGTGQVQARQSQPWPMAKWSQSPVSSNAAHPSRLCEDTS